MQLFRMAAVAVEGRQERRGGPVGHSNSAATATGRTPTDPRNRKLTGGDVEKKAYRNETILGNPPLTVPGRRESVPRRWGRGGALRSGLSFEPTGHVFRSTSKFSQHL